MKTLSICSFIVAFLFTGMKCSALNLPNDSADVVKQANTSTRVFQVSFVPFFGTNGLQSASFVNIISFNILAGYNGGTNGFELGGLVNIDKFDVNATQIAGIGNKNGGAIKGLQLAGIFNQSNSLIGTQIAGISNMTKEIYGVQIGGILNYNITGKSVQIAGITNSTDDRATFQLAGLTNRARIALGSQLSGIFNLSREVNGSQISGILNIASHIRGSQIGLINIADTCNGVAIGLINIIKNGYRQFEISADEFYQTNFAFRSGVDKFHAIITAGIQPKNFDTPVWTYGVGAGTSKSITAKSKFDFDFTFQNIIHKAEVGNNYLYRAYLGVDRTLNTHLSLAIGVTYNFLVTDLRQDAHHELYTDIAPYSFTNHNYSQTNLKTWAGIKIGLRFP